MISTISGLTDSLPKWLARSDIDSSDLSDIILLAVSEAATQLDYHLSETVITTEAIDAQISAPMPDYTAGISRFYIAGTQYTRRSMSDVLKGAEDNIYAVRGGDVFWYPSAAAGKQIEFHIRMLHRSSQDGTGVAPDMLGEIYYRSEAITDVTEDEPDNAGRYAVLINEVTYPVIGADDYTDGDPVLVDNVGQEANAVDKLIGRFPQLFQALAMSHAYAYLQDEASEAKWFGKASNYMETAKMKLIQSEYGADKLTIPMRGSRYSAAITSY